MKQIQLIKLKSEKKFDNRGYVLIFIDGTWIQEHRYVVSKFINRELTKEEVIHHIDGNKQNNDLNNLQIFDSNNKHMSFHNKVKRWGYTRPILREIEHRWDKYLIKND